MKPAWKELKWGDLEIIQDSAKCPADSLVRQGQLQQMFSRANSITLGTAMCNIEVMQE